MAEYFANGSLHYQDGEWRDDNGDVVEIEQVIHGEWIERIIDVEHPNGYYQEEIYICPYCCRTEKEKEPYCNCGAKMDGKVLPHKFLGKSQDGECGVEILDGKGDA